MDKHTERAKKYGLDPELANHETFAEIADNLEDIAKVFKSVEMVRVKGEPGKDGKTPVKGTDYFTKEEIEKLISIIQSRVKVDIDEKLIRTVLSRIPKPKDGTPGKDAVVDYGQIRSYIK